jgi:aryl-alcohol dehydrogenase-like predicted oxidoreductase
VTGADAPVDVPSTRLGVGGPPVTAVGLGLAALGRPAYITLGRDDDLGADRSEATMERRSHEVLDAAYGAGIRYVDVARSYGRAEEFLASWLKRRQVASGTITVGSKWGYRYVGGWQMDSAVHERKDHSLTTFSEQWPKSLELLGAHLRLYQIHSATLDSGVLADGAVLGALSDTRARGIAIGLSVSGPRQAAVIRRALDVDIDGANPFSVVQATWNLLEPSVGPALAEAHDRGWGVIVKEALSNGRLTGQAGAARAELRRTAERQEASVDQVAIAAALAQPWADVVLSGAVTVGQLESNVGALRLTLNGDDAPLLAALAEDPEQYWNRRSALPWH